MSAPPYMKLYVADYLGDTHALNVVEHGAYMLLLMGMWRAGGKLPADDAKLAKVARCTAEQWAEVRDAVLPYFRRRGGQLTHKRVSEEMAKYETVSAKRRDASNKGVSEKRRKNSKVDEPNGSENRDHLETKPEPESYTPIVPVPGTSEERPTGLKPTPATDDIAEAFRLWNETAERCGLPIAKDLTEPRRRALRSRLKAGGLDRWREAMAKVEVSAFLCGERPDREGNTFRAHLDFVLQTSSFQKLIEGTYRADRKRPEPKASAPVDPLAVWRHRVGEYRRKGRDGFWDDLGWGDRPGRPGCRAPAAVLSEFGFTVAEVIPLPTSDRSAA